MSWRVCVWVLLLNCSVLALQKDERNKRFMVLQAVSKGQVPKGAIKSNTLDHYKDWRATHGHPSPKRAPPAPYQTGPATLRRAAARTDRLLVDGEHIAREHAKLVHDINGLSESYPAWMRHRDDETTTFRSELKDESIYMENLEPSSAAPPPPPPPPAAASSARPPAVNLKIVPGAGAKPLALPLIVLGGETKPRVTPTKHPYAFVGAASTARPARLRPVMPLAYPVRLAPPTLWQRFLSIFPKIIR